MKKNFFLMAMLMVSTIIFAAEPKVTLDFTDNTDWNLPTAAAKETATFTNSGVSVTLTAPDGYYYHGTGKMLLMGKQGATMTFSALDFNLSKIVVEGGSSASQSVKINVFVGEDAVSTETTGLKLADGPKEFIIANDKRAAGTIYTIKVTSKHNAQFTKIYLYEAVAGAPDAPTFSVEEGAYIQDVNVELACATEGADVYYTLDGTEPTKESTKYASAITINAGKEVTVKAIAYKNDIASEISTAVYNVVVTDGDGSKESPFSVADVLKLNTKYVNKEKQWVVAYVLGSANGSLSKIDNTKNSNIVVSDAMEKADTIAFELNNESAKKALNVVDGDNKENIIGKQVKVFGSLAELYFGKPGVKAITDQEILTEPFKRPVYYNLTLTQPAEGGTIAADKEGLVAAGATVTLSATPKENYGLDKYIVTKTDNTAVEVTDNTFVMPESDVTVTAAFKVAVAHKITIVAEHGTVVADPATATVGTTVTLKITPDADYVLDAVKVEDAGKKAIEVKDNKFAMPDADVTVTVTFKAYEYTLAQFMEDKPTEAKKITETLTVLFNNGDNTYVTNGTLYICVYDKGSAFVKDVENGSTLTGITGTYGIYNGIPEIIPTAAPVVAKGEAVAPIEITAAPVAADVCKLVRVKEQQVTVEDAKAYVFGSIQIYDSYKLGYEAVAGTWTFDAIVSIFKDAVQLIPIAAPTITPAADALDEVEVSLDLNAPMFNLLGQQVDAQYKGVVIQNGKKFFRQ